MNKKFSPDNFMDVFTQYVNDSLIEKATILSEAKGVNASYDEKSGSFSVNFDKGVGKDIEQNRAGVLLHGGVILTQKGAEKKKNKENLTQDDYYVVPPMGKEL